ncbi:MAG: glycoside hydrolase family 3 C-terminal domain-containing protein, partial [Clostridiales bacterium]|nr:glycoside hydrolase family 3 C-terminal domain-containing protein [Clostridiales bacterium]
AGIAEEAGAAGVALLLGPGVNIKRNPLCGRNFEYFSEDPYLSGKLGAAYIAGAQRTGVGACLKHFACNNQEYFRMTSDSILDERTLRELYLTAFEIAVKEGAPASVMCAYNRINGVYCSDNRRLLTDILRGEWGFDGLVVTDWGALNDRSKAFEAGCDLVMPGGNAYGEKAARLAAETGELPEGFIDGSAARVARFAKERDEALKARPFAVDLERQHGLARRIAEESAVLLKNDGGLLPCAKEGIALIGRFADAFPIQGNGSSRVNPVKTESLRSLWPDVPYAAGCDKDGNATEETIAEALSLAKSAKTVVIVAGLPDVDTSEGYDRACLGLPEGQNRLIAETAKVNPNIAVVLCCGGAVETPWAGEVKAVLYMGLSGQAGAAALANLLTGRANPCGRLAETWPLRYEDCASAPFYGAPNRNAEYREGIYAGYRYYEKAEKPVRFPFGAGLSYTAFSYHDLVVTGTEAHVTVTNSGGRFGGEAVLLFVRAPQDGIHRPVRELKGFEKIFLGPGESREICFELNDRSFAVWDGGWRVYAGEYAVQVGPCTASVRVDGETWSAKPQGWYRPLAGDCPRADWIEALGFTPEEEPARPYTVNSTMTDIAKDSAGVRAGLRVFKIIQALACGRGTADYKITVRGAEESPLRNVQNMLKIRGGFAQSIAGFANRKPV